MNIDKLDRRIEIRRYACLILEAMKNWITILDYEDMLNAIPQDAKMMMFNSRVYEPVCCERSRNKQVTWVFYVKYDREKDVFKWMTKSHDKSENQRDNSKNLFNIIDTIVLHKVDEKFLDRLRRLAE